LIDFSIFRAPAAKKCTQIQSLHGRTFFAKSDTKPIRNDAVELRIQYSESRRKTAQTKGIAQNIRAHSISHRSVPAKEKKHLSLSHSEDWFYFWILNSGF